MLIETADAGEDVGIFGQQGIAALLTGRRAKRTQHERDLRLQAFANLAHELRTPVQVFLGYLDMLRDDMVRSPGAASREILARMNVNALGLAHTVENVMDFAAFDNNDADEEIELSDLVDEIMPLLEAANHGKNLELRVDLEAAPRYVRARRRAIRAILANLAINAVRFTVSGSVTIAITTGPTLEGHNTLVLTVSDTGQGISADIINSIFDRFVQGSKTNTRTHRGLGLGLSVVKRNVAMLGGWIEIQSGEGAGTRFQVTIPCSEVAPSRNIWALPYPGAVNESRCAPQPVYR